MRHNLRISETFLEKSAELKCIVYIVEYQYTGPALYMGQGALSRVSLGLLYTGKTPIHLESVTLNLKALS